MRSLTGNKRCLKRKKKTCNPHLPGEACLVLFIPGNILETRSTMRVELSDHFVPERRTSCLTQNRRNSIPVFCNMVVFHINRKATGPFVTLLLQLSQNHFLDDPVTVYMYSRASHVRNLRIELGWTSAVACMCLRDPFSAARCPFFFLPRFDVFRREQLKVPLVSSARYRHAGGDEKHRFGAR